MITVINDCHQFSAHKGDFLENQCNYLFSAKLAGFVIKNANIFAILFNENIFSPKFKQLLLTYPKRRDDSLTHQNVNPEIVFGVVDEVWPGHVLLDNQGTLLRNLLLKIMKQSEQDLST
jgi:hypothetical protein